MIRIEKTVVYGLGEAIRGMRNPMNSWDKSDTVCTEGDGANVMEVGENDYNLMMKLSEKGSVHAKFKRMIAVYADITAPLYWWKEYDTYKVGTVANSCSTMHKIADKKFTLNDFSWDKLEDICEVSWVEDENGKKWTDGITTLETVINVLNAYRYQYLKTKDKKYWWQMIQLLPSSYNQKRTVMLNYEVLTNIYIYRKDHKLDEWRKFCKWIETLPLSELMTGENLNNE